MTNMFSHEELSNFLGVLKVTPEFIEIDCGCTNPRYGDTPGILRLFPDGKIEIDCNCRPDCDRGTLPLNILLDMLYNFIKYLSVN